MLLEILSVAILLMALTPLLLLLFLIVPYLYLLLIMIFSPDRVRLGSSRVVVLMGPYAYKLPTFSTWRGFLKGLLANMSEATFSKVRSRHLAPATAALPGGLLVCMPRVEPVSTEMEDMAKTEWRNALALLPPNDRTMLENIVEDKIDSFGWLDGRLVAIDYGKINME